jgi:hypothetical protein
MLLDAEQLAEVQKDRGRIHNILTTYTQEMLATAHMILSIGKKAPDQAGSYTL